MKHMLRWGRILAAVVLALSIAIPLNALLLVFQGGLRWEEVTPRALFGFALGGLFVVDQNHADAHPTGTSRRTTVPKGNDRRRTPSP